MIDFVSIIIASGAVIIALLSHIKHSKCCGVVEVDMKDEKPQDITPLLRKDNEKTD